VSCEGKKSAYMLVCERMSDAIRGACAPLVRVLVRSVRAT